MSDEMKMTFKSRWQVLTSYLTVMTHVVVMLTWGRYLSTVEALTHGRDAVAGEFPFILRIRIADIADDASRKATGILVRPTRVLTTCDSVGFFTGVSITKHDLKRVAIMGGSVSADGRDGIMKSPVSSSHHPRCYLLASGVVLFNYGLYEVGEADPFQIPNSDRLRPLQHFFRSQQHMETTLRYYLDADPDSYTCFSTGWGYPQKSFEDDVEPDDFIAASDTLQVTTVKFTSYERCHEMSCIYFGDCFTSLWEYGLVCAVAPKGGPCKNDWGSPIVCAGQVFGILVAARRCTDAPVPRQFVRIDLAYDYIFGNGTGLGVRLPIQDFLLLFAALLALNKF